MTARVNTPKAPVAAAKPRRSRGVQTVAAKPKVPPVVAKPKPRAKPKTPPVVTPERKRAKRFNGTREQWLAAIVEDFRPDFKAAGAPLPKVVKVSCGFASHGIRSNVIGECWVPAASAAKVPEIFIVPRMHDSIEVAAILVHELVHAAGIRGHGADFKKVAEALGLTGKMTATVPGPDACKRIVAALKRIGEYPHAELDPRLALPKPGEKVPPLLPGEKAPEDIGWSSGPPKQGTRMLKVSCGACGCVVRMTRSWITDAGLPTCGCGGAMTEA